MGDSQVAALLSDGIRAAQQGHLVKARDLLLRVVDRDPHNEQGWLQLGAVLEAEDDRRICLEHVLAFNPKNAAAISELARLEKPLSAPVKQVPATRHSDSEPRPSRGDNATSPATSVDREPGETESWTPIYSRRNPSAPRSAFDDIWDKDTPICAYCAAEIEPDDRRCPDCGRKLLQYRYLYPKASVDLTIYLVLIVGVIELYLVQGLLNILVEGNLGSGIWQVTVFGALAILALGLAFRRFWAYVGSIVALLLIFAAMLLDGISGFGPETILEAAIKADFFQAVAASSVVTLGSPLLKFIRPLQVLVIVLALAYGIFKVGPDFVRVKHKLAARVDRSLSESTEFYIAGRKLAEGGMWAGAVLHWQRAAALEPTRVIYLSSLGQAYARLGHYQRSLDVLESALRLAKYPADISKIEGRVRAIRQRVPQPVGDN